MAVCLGVVCGRAYVVVACVAVFRRGCFGVGFCERGAAAVWARFVWAWLCGRGYVGLTLCGRGCVGVSCVGVAACVGATECGSDHEGLAVFGFGFVWAWLCICLWLCVGVAV